MPLENNTQRTRHTHRTTVALAIYGRVASSLVRSEQKQQKASLKPVQTFYNSSSSCCKDVTYFFLIISIECGEIQMKALEKNIYEIILPSSFLQKSAVKCIKSTCVFKIIILTFLTVVLRLRNYCICSIENLK